jgi:hypothetical protein
MTVESDMALLAADAYRDIRALDVNRAPVPAGWSELSQYAITGLNRPEFHGGPLV